MSVKAAHHPTLPLVSLKYSQIDSPKLHPVVRDCRGIVLEKDTWDVVAKPFRRFFNAGEDSECYRTFGWADCSATSKEDGSLIILYNYDGAWHVNTSGSFGLGECGHSGKSWVQLFWETSLINQEDLDCELTYLFEMWTPFNKVIRTYPDPKVFLLSAFYLPRMEEVSVFEADHLGKFLGMARPEQLRFRSEADVAAFLAAKQRVDPTFEGVVVRDSNNDRYKIKSATYVALHHLVDNGNLFNPKRLVPLALAGEIGEAIAYLPEVKPYAERVQADLDAELDSLLQVWRAARPIEGQREFAQAVLKHRFSGLLFALRKELREGDGEAALIEKWRGSADVIVKTMYGATKVA